MPDSANSRRNTPRWGYYFIALFVGGAFFSVLVLYTWHIALEKKQNAFSLEVALIQETAIRNIYSGDDTVNSVAAYFHSRPDVSQHEFNIFTDDLLHKYRHIESIDYYTRSDPGGDPFALTHRNSRRKDTPSIEGYFSSGYKPLAEREGLTDETVPVVTDGENDRQKKLWLLIFLSLENTAADTGKSSANPLTNGVAAVLIAPEKLLENYVNASGLSIAMHGRADNLSGLPSLYFNDGKGAPADSWKIDTLLDEKIIQLPGYSIQLSISRDIYSSDMEYHLIFIAILLGTSITLLLFALFREKKIQANELINRNTLIERKVEEQTRELEIARNNALQASRMKSDFLAIMSHEIRTPLNAIIGMADVLSETRLSDEQKKYMQVFRNAGATLFSLVNNILDLSKIEANQMVLENIPFELVALIEEVAEIYAIKAAEKNIDIVCSIGPELNRNRIGDPSRLRQIILNLIGNALKFTDAGEIVIDVQAGDDRGSGHRLKFSISDTGIGIPADKLDSIFSSFAQADLSTTRKYGGSGLGLTISKRLVELMDGDLQVQSIENKGTTFSFRVTLQQQGDAADIQQSLRGKSVLLIDDHPANSSVVSTLLEAAGMQSEFITGEAMILKFDAPASADLVVADSGLIFQGRAPVLDRLLTKYRKSQLMLMINPAQMKSHIALAKKKKLNNFIIKPIKRDELISRVEKTLLEKQAIPEDTAASGSLSTGREQAETRGKHILLVEDNPDNRLLINAYLKSTPHTVEEAENGQIAVELFKKGKYDLILMDVQMPIMDGHEAVRAIRQWEQEKNARHTPVISLTAHAVKEEIDKCFEAGCDFYLSKPVKKSTLLQAIERLD